MIIPSNIWLVISWQFFLAVCDLLALGHCTTLFLDANSGCLFVIVPSNLCVSCWRWKVLIPSFSEDCHLHVHSRLYKELNLTSILVSSTISCSWTSCPWAISWSFSLIFFLLSTCISMSSILSHYYVLWTSLSAETTRDENLQYLSYGLTDCAREMKR